MGQTYLVSGTLKHDGQVYRDGEQFSTDDPAVERDLRRGKAILLPEEYAAAAASEGNTAMQEELAAERAALAAKVAELEAKLAAAEAAKSVDKSGK